MSGLIPDPPEPAGNGEHAARLKLTKALERAKYAIAWEYAWPGLARLLTVIGLFLVVSWAGLWPALPFIARAIGLGLFAVSLKQQLCQFVRCLEIGTTLFPEKILHVESWRAVG